MNKLGEHLFWLEDTCSVYAIKADDKYLLIDCGTDLRRDNVEGVETILLTHFHRDQCSGVEYWSG